MGALNVWIPCFDDLDQLEMALESTVPYATAPYDVTVHVIDGRYATFEGASNTTEMADPLCQGYDHVQYHAPAPKDLPFGDPGDPGYLRSPQHEQATWVNYDVLPQEEWALEMDTDERLETLSLTALEDLDPRRKYTPQVLTDDGEQLKPAIRLYQPRYWTFWIDDVMFWRDFYPRSTSLQQLFEAHVQSAHRNTGYGGETEALTIRNRGLSRPDEYNQRRAAQLEEMGSEWAARALRDGEYPSTVDFRDYAQEGEEVVQDG